MTIRKATLTYSKALMPYSVFVKYTVNRGVKRKFSKRANTELMPYKAASPNNFLIPVMG